jgi:hypothetical protein
MEQEAAAMAPLPEPGAQEVVATTRLSLSELLGGHYRSRMIFAPRTTGRSLEEVNA